VVLRLWLLVHKLILNPSLFSWLAFKEILPWNSVLAPRLKAAADGSTNGLAEGSDEGFEGGCLGNTKDGLVGVVVGGHFGGFDGFHHCRRIYGFVADST
jgi:hypothetical protein